MYKFKATNGWRSFGYTNAAIANRQVSVSFNMKVIGAESDSTTAYIKIGRTSAVTYNEDRDVWKQSDGKDKWKHYEFTFAASANTCINIMIRETDSSGKSCTVLINNFQINDGPCASAYLNSPSQSAFLSDISGFGNHGTITGNWTLTTGGPRYDKQLLASLNSSITAPNLLAGTNVCTVSFWANIPNILKDGTHWTFIKSGFEIFKHEGQDNAYVGVPRAEGRQWAEFNATNGWQHFVFISTGSKIQTWRNGVMIKEADWIMSNMPTSIEFNVGQSANAGYSDIRLYATALDESAIKELYALGK